MTNKSRAEHHAAALRIVERLDSDITPEQIRQGCLEVQARWTEDERQRRIVGRQNPDLTVMETRFSFGE